MRIATFSFSRVGWIARNTMQEAVRQRVFVFVVALAVALVASALFLREFNFGASELKFLADFGFGALTFFGSLLAIVVTAQLFFGEIENRTVLTLLAKPVHRSEFVVGKFVGVWAVLLVFCVVVGVALGAVLFFRESALMAAHPEAFAQGRVVNYAGGGAFFVLQWLKFGVIAGFTILIASYAQTNLFTVFSAFLVLVISHLQHLAQGAWERAGGLLARVGAAILAFVFPNFQLFNIGDQVAAGGVVSLALIARVVAYAVVYLVVVLALATFMFRRREV